MEDDIFKNERVYRTLELRGHVRVDPKVNEDASEIFWGMQNILINWLKDHVGNDVMPQVEEGKSFSYQGENQRRLDVISDGEEWAFRASYPSNSGGMRITEASLSAGKKNRVELEAAHGVLLAENETDPYPRNPEIPAFIGRIAAQYPLMDGTQRLNPERVVISRKLHADRGKENIDAINLAAFISLNGRRQPVVIFAQPENAPDKKDFATENKIFLKHAMSVARQIATNTAGCAHVIILTNEVTSAFNQEQDNQVLPGEIRLYPPYELPDSPTSLWTAASSGPKSETTSAAQRWLAFENKLLKRIAQTTCKDGFGLKKSFSPFLELQQKVSPSDVPAVKSLTSEQSLETLVSISTRLEEIESARAQDAPQNQRQLAQELRGLIDTLRQIKKSDTTGELGELLQETIDKGSNIRSGFMAAAYGITKPYQEKYDTLNAWVEEYYKDKIVLSNATKAILQKPKIAKFEDVNLIYAAVELLATHYHGMMVAQGPTQALHQKFHRRMFDERLTKLHLFDDHSASKNTLKRMRAEYTAKVDGIDHLLDRHLKDNSGSTDARKSVRIYYAWDDARKRIIIGSIAGHKRNTLTS